MNNNVEKLKDMAAEISAEALIVANHFLEDERLRTWSGSSKEHQHHYGDGGLAKHTLEVVELCKLNLAYFRTDSPNFPFPDKWHKGIDWAELFFAALFHDSGKMYDYHVNEDGIWTSSTHKRMIHHISRSGIIWTEACSKSSVSDIKYKYFEPVLHAILSHHGQRDFGSPVAPKSRVAWLVHLCDGISARMDDADTLDIVQHRK